MRKRGQTAAWRAGGLLMLLGYGIPTGSIIPRQLDGALALEPYAYDPTKAQQLLAEAGYANGFEAGECAVNLQPTASSVCSSLAPASGSG